MMNVLHGLFKVLLNTRTSKRTMIDNHHTVKIYRFTYDEIFRAVGSNFPFKLHVTIQVKSYTLQKKKIFGKDVVFLWTV